jgi:hypothetical protein
MGIAEDITALEQLLANLVTRYEQYFIGLEKREPLQLRTDVEKMVRRYAGTPINNTMYKHKYNTLVARFNSYREHWNRIIRLIDEGRYSRDRFISDLHQRNHRKQTDAVVCSNPERNDLADTEMERIYHEYREARVACNLPVKNLNRDMVAATIEKKRPSLEARLGNDDLTFRVVVEDGKPKIKASPRK